MSEDKPNSNDSTIRVPRHEDDAETPIEGAAAGTDVGWANMVVLGLSSPVIESGGERYTVVGQLGQGGHGEVFEVVDSRMHRTVALKRLHTDSPAEASFLREARLTGRLDHPNVIPVHDLGIDEEGSVYYTMKRIEGGSLQHHIRAGNLGSIVERLQIFLKICDAVGFAHAQGFVHRDLKPSNVMVGTHGQVLVVDWGLARPIGAPGSEGEDPDSDGTYTRAAGTPGYMPPEQARGEAERLDERTDIFALGALLHVLLTGQSFYKDPRLALYNANIDTPPPVSPSGPLFPRELRALVVKACSPISEDRYQKVNDLRDEVVRFMEDVPLRSVRYSALERLRRWMRRHRGLVQGAGAVLLTAAVVLTISGTIYVRDVQQAQRKTELQQRETERQLGLTEVAQAMVLLEGSRVEEGLSIARSALERLETLGIETADISLSVRLYGQLHPGRYLQWKAGTGRFRAQAINADGSRALAAFGSEVSLWSLPEARRIASWTVPDDDGRVVVSFVGEQATVFWIAGNEVTQATLPDGTVVRSYGRAERFQVFPQRGAIVIYEKADQHRVHDLQSGEERTFHPGPESVSHYTNNGRLARVEKSGDGPGSSMVSTWLLGERRFLLGPDDILLFSPDERFRFHKEWPRKNSGLTETRSVFFDLDNGTDEPLDDVTHEAAFSQDSSVLVASTGKNEIVVRDTETLETRVRARSLGQESWVLSQEGDRLLSYRPDGDLLLYLIDGAGAPVQVPVVPEPVVAASPLAVEFSGDGVLVAVSGFDQPISLFEVGTRRPLAHFGPTPEGVRDLSFSPDDLLLAAAGRDGRVTVWDVASGTLSSTHQLEGQRVCSVDWIDASTLVALGCKGRLLRWTLGTPPTLLQQLDGTTWRVRKTPTGTLTVTQRMGPANLVVLDGETGTILARNISHPTDEPRYGVTISPDGTLAAASSGSGTFYVYDTASLAPVAEFGTPFGCCGLGVVFHPTRPLLVTSTEHGEIVFWDTRTWERLSTVEAHSEDISDLAVSEDGRWLASVGADGKLAVLDLDGPLPWEATEAVAVPLKPGEVATPERIQRLGEAAAAFGSPQLALELLRDDLSALERARLETLVGDPRAESDWKKAAAEGSVSPSSLAQVLRSLKR